MRTEYPKRCHVRGAPWKPVLRQNVVRLSDSLGSIPDPAAKTLSRVEGKATAVFRPAALHRHTGFAKRTGSGRQSRTCEASSVVMGTGGGGPPPPAGLARMQATRVGDLHGPAR